MFSSVLERLPRVNLKAAGMVILITGIALLACYAFLHAFGLSFIGGIMVTIAIIGWWLNVKDHFLVIAV